MKRLCPVALTLLLGVSLDMHAARVLRIAVTTSMLGDAVQHITQGRAHVHVLMGAGVDPHAYKATPRDVEALQAADIIFYNGLQLEGKMAHVLGQLARIKPVYAAAHALQDKDLLRDTLFQQGIDPHIWFDVQLWQRVVAYIAKVLQEHAPQEASWYAACAHAYIKELEKLHHTVQQKLQAIPPSRRILITAHDAFGYFGRAYGIQVQALQGISTLSEYGIRDVMTLVDSIVAQKIRAIFLETSVPTRPMEAVIEAVRLRGHEVRMGGYLYSDSMGEPGTLQGTYQGMVLANVETLLQALQ